MKKLFSLIIFLLSIFILMSCNMPNEIKPPINGDNNDEENGNDKNNIEEKETSKINLGGDDFIIMVDNSSMSDPRSETYEYLFQEEKTAKIKYVENKYNVKVKYVNYPSNASWGQARESFIIEQSKMGVEPAHVFEINSNSVANLAIKGAIIPLDDLIEVYGKEGYWPEKLLFGQLFDRYYLYSDMYSFADNDLYYNSDLLAEILGEDRRYEPTEKWLDGTWDWDAFKDLAIELKSYLNANREPEEGGPQYVLGGRTYNWLYPMLGANGTQLVSPDLETHLTDEPVMDIINYLHSLYEIERMWLDNAPLDNTVQPQFLAGNIAFHDGQSWYTYIGNKWLNATFQIDFVPFPKGPNIKEDMSNYKVSMVYGTAAHAISSSFDKKNIPPGYEDILINDEIIFQIWQDLQYFPEVDSNTGYFDLAPVKEDFYNVRLMPFYGSNKSIQAHLDVFNLASPDLFYSLPESQKHIEGSYMLALQSGIRYGGVRNKLESLESELKAAINDRFFNYEG